jgi:ClpP class serine protease
METQRRTIETLTEQAMQRIVQTQAEALQSIQAQQQATERALIDALTRLTEQSSALQTLPKQTKQAAAQAMQAAQSMQQTARKYRPLRLWHVLVLTLTGAVLAGSLTLAGMHAFANPVPQNAQPQMQQ